MAQEELIQVSIAEMNWHKKNGMKDVEPRSFPHYKRIAKEFDKAKKRAWAKVKQDPRAQALIKEGRAKDIRDTQARRESIEALLNIRK